MYDVTYASRGKSGIPRDTRSLGKILCNIPYTQVGFILSAKSFLSRYPFERFTAQQNYNQLLGDTLLDSRNYYFHWFPHKFIRSCLQSISLQPFLGSHKLNLKQMKLTLNYLQLNTLDFKNLHFFVILKISYLARFIRPKIFGLFRMKTRGIDVFIQQQVDPIRVDKKTKHLVRLHDILPITHPFFFTKKAQVGFRNGLLRMLKNKKIVWVMDTLASKNEFIEIFGDQLKVEVIPCEVGSGWDSDTALKKIIKKSLKKTNKFLVVSTIEPRKNISLIIDAFLHIKRENSFDPKSQLIIAGNHGWMQETLVNQLRKGKFGSDIIFFEDPSDDLIENLYSEANFLITASEAEGFGFTPLEGMFFGCIPIVSDIPQHRETMGKNAIYFETYGKSLIRALEKAVKIPLKERATLQIKGRNFVLANYSGTELTQKWSSLIKNL